MSSASPDKDRPRPTVVVVGGGLAGAVAAHQLARRAPGRLDVVVVEPRERIGAGVAYSTTDPAHRINVPAARMSFVPSDPCHFDRWLKADRALVEDPEALTPDGRAFPRRAVFGRYAAETIEPYLLSGAVEHRRAAASAIRRRGGRHVVSLDDGGPDIVADYVAFAATHPAPCPPDALAPLAGDARMIVDTQKREALDAAPSEARVLIVGTGLTMADIVASLARRGHRGPIVAVSRRGLLSRGHCDAAGEFGDYASRPAATALAALRLIRATVAEATAAGVPWQHALDGVRNQGNAIWAALSEAERRKVVRRLRPFWDVHRFRVAPQVEAVIAGLRENGRLTVLTGEPVAVRAGEGAIEVDFRLRGGRRDSRAFDLVIVATGPAHRKLGETSPLVAGLLADGVLSLDRVGLGFEADRSSRAVGPNGAPARDFWIVGPLARGSFGELMGLPEVARHAEFVAEDIVRTVAADDARPSAKAARQPAREVA